MAASVGSQAASVSTVPGDLLIRTLSSTTVLPALSMSMPKSLLSVQLRSTKRKQSRQP